MRVIENGAAAWPPAVWFVAGLLLGAAAGLVTGIDVAARAVGW